METGVYVSLKTTASKGGLTKFLSSFLTVTFVHCQLMTNLHCICCANTSFRLNS